ncbi:MAG: hypothetical protein ABSH34_00280 [Verrucomicrobiota bacterium]|jgi:hypothetical protein
MKENPSDISESAFKPLVRGLLPARQVNGIIDQDGPVEHGPHWITPLELIDGMVFHVLQKAGTLAQHVSGVRP